MPSSLLQVVEQLVPNLLQQLEKRQQAVQIQPITTCRSDD